jgi:voltage-gated potassium channel
MTTVGYGNVTPHTVAGQALASFVMIMGYGILAVPTGILSVEMAGVARQKLTTEACPECSDEGHAQGARFCKNCGARL